MHWKVSQYKESKLEHFAVEYRVADINVEHGHDMSMAVGIKWTHTLDSSSGKQQFSRNHQWLFLSLIFFPVGVPFW